MKNTIGTNFKRELSAFMALVMMLSLVPAQVFADFSEMLAALEETTPIVSTMDGTFVTGEGEDGEPDVIELSGYDVNAEDVDTEQAKALEDLFAAALVSEDAWESGEWNDATPLVMGSDIEGTIEVPDGSVLLVAPPSEEDGYIWMVDNIGTGDVCWAEHADVAIEVTVSRVPTAEGDEQTEEETEAPAEPEKFYAGDQVAVTISVTGTASLHGANVVFEAPATLAAGETLPTGWTKSEPDNGYYYYTLNKANVGNVKELGSFVFTIEPDPNGHEGNTYNLPITVVKAELARTKAEASSTISRIEPKCGSAVVSVYAIPVTFADANGSVLKTQYIDKNGWAVEYTPKKTGYTFSDWYGSTEEDAAVYSFETLITEETTIYARWKPDDFTVNFNVNGAGCAAPDSMTLTYDEVKGGMLPVLTEQLPEGKKFLGWATAAGAEHAEYSGALTAQQVNALYGECENGSVTLYAVFGAQDYKIEYELNGGAWSSGEPTVSGYTYGTSVTLPTDVIRTGYEFAGWFAKEDLSGEPVTEVTAEDFGDKTFYAAWTPETGTAYRVEHYQENLDDKDFTLANTDNLTGTTDADTAAQAKTYAGFTVKEFKQETIKGDGSTVVKIYYDRNEYKLTWNANGGSFANGGGTKEETVKYGAAIELKPAPTQAGCFFEGWFTEATGGTEVTMDSTVSGEQTFYAHWLNAADVVATVTTNGNQVTGYTTVEAALNAAKTGDVVTLMKNAELQNSQYVLSEKSITFTAAKVGGTDDAPVYASLMPHNTGTPATARRLFEISADAGLTLRNVTLKGLAGKNQQLQESKGGAAIYNHGTLKIEEGTTVQDFYNYSYGGAISNGAGGVINMTGGLITNCRVGGGNGGAAIYNYDGSVFRMSGGEITGCYSEVSSTSSGDSAVAVEYGAKMYLSGDARVIGNFYRNQRTLAEAPRNINLMEKNYNLSTDQFVLDGNYSGEAGLYTTSWHNRSNDIIGSAANNADFVEGGKIICDLGQQLTAFVEGQNVKWKYATYQIRYVESDGTWAEGQPTVTSYVCNTGATLPTAEQITRTGYTFMGWYDNAEFTGNAVNSVGSSEYGDKTFYAKWEESEYTITYKDQGDAAFSGTNETSLPATHTYGTETILPDAVKTGYTFKGWFTTSDCSGTAVTSLGATDYTENITLYAKWTINTYTIIFVANGGSYVESYTAPTSYNYGDTVTLPTEANITKTGYTFMGWYDNAGFTGNEVTSVGSSGYGDKTFYAKWEESKYTITYNLDGGSVAAGTPNPSTYTIKTTTFTLNNPTREGYIFKGWTGTDLSVATETVKITEGSTGDRGYTATWEQDVNSDHWVASTRTSKSDTNPTLYASIEEALNKALSGGIVTLLRDQEMQGEYTLKNEITLTAADVDDGNGGTRPAILTAKKDTRMFWLYGNTPAKLTLEHITLRGNGTVSENGGGVYVQGSSWLTLNEGAVIEGFTVTGAGGGVYAVNGAGAARVTMNSGAVIRDCVAQSTQFGGGGIYVSSGPVLTLNGGTITGNKSNYPGGAGVYAHNGLSFGGNVTVYDNYQTGTTSQKNIYVWNNDYDNRLILLSGAFTGKVGIEYGLNANTSKNLNKSGAKFGTANGSIGTDGQILSDYDEHLIGSKVGSDLKWVGMSYTIELNANGGSYVAPYTEPTSYNYGNTVKLPTAGQITKEGYTFNGWYTQDGTNEGWGDKVEEIGATEYGDKTYFAQWQINNYTFTATTDNETMGAVTGGGAYDFGTSVTLTATANAGYQFVKWTKTVGETVTDNYSTSATLSLTSNAENEGEYTAYFALNTESDHWAAKVKGITDSSNINKVDDNGTTWYYYTSLKDAVTAVNNMSSTTEEGTVIELLQGAEMSGKLIVTNPCTLDLSDEVLTFTGEREDNDTSTGITCSLTIKNGSMIDPNTDMYTALNGSSLVNIPSTATGIITLENVNMTADNFACIRSSNVEVRYNGGVYNVRVLLSEDKDMETGGKVSINPNDGKGHNTYMNIANGWYFHNDRNKFEVEINGGYFTNSEVGEYGCVWESNGYNIPTNIPTHDIKQHIAAGKMWIDTPYGEGALEVDAAAHENGYRFKVVTAGRVQFELGDGVLNGYSAYTDNEDYYCYDANGEGLTLPTKDEVKRDGYTLTGWTTNADGTGTLYGPGDNYTAGAAGTETVPTLYAKWEINTDDGHWAAVVIPRGGENDDHYLQESIEYLRYSTDTFGELWSATPNTKTVALGGEKFVDNDGNVTYYYPSIEAAMLVAQAGEMSPEEAMTKPAADSGEVSLNIDTIGGKTDTVKLLTNYTVEPLFNFGFLKHSSSAYNDHSYDYVKKNPDAWVYGIGKGIIIDLNGKTVKGISAGLIPDGQTLIVMNGKVAGSNDSIDDECGNGYCTGNVIFSDVKMTGENFWLSRHDVYILDGYYQVKKADVDDDKTNPGTLHLCGGYYKNDPSSLNTQIELVDLGMYHVEDYISANSGVYWFDGDGAAVYEYHVVYGATQYNVEFNKNTTDDVTGMPGNVSNIKYGDSENYSLPSAEPTREGYFFTGWKYDGKLVVDTVTNNETQIAFTKLTTEHTSTVILDAQWSEVVARVNNANASATGCVGTETEGDVEWKYFTTIQYAVNAATSGTGTTTVQLIKNVQESGITVDKTLTLDLNGYVLRGMGSVGIMTVSSNGNLTIKDSRYTTATHYYTYRNGAAWMIGDDAYVGAFVPYADDMSTAGLTDGTSVIAVKGGAIAGNATSCAAVCVSADATLTLESGNIVGNLNNCGSGNACCGAGVHAEGVDAKFNMNGGRIIGNHAYMYGGGVGVIDGGVFTMTGGTVSHNYANQQGGALCANGRFDIRDGTLNYNAAGYDGGAIHTWSDATAAVSSTISGGTITGNTAGSLGGAIHYADDGSKVHSLAITGGTITGNTAGTARTGGTGGGVWAGKSDLTLGGSANITGNMTTNSTTAKTTENNVYLASGQTVTLATDFNGTVGVTLANGSGVVTAGENTDYHGCFSNDVTGFTVIDMKEINTAAANHQVALAATVTLDATDGAFTTEGTKTVCAVNGQPMFTTTDIPTRTGYTFAGYFDNTTDGKKYYENDGTSANTWDKTGTTATLYAHWTGNDYTIEYNHGVTGGFAPFWSITGSTAAQTATFGTAANLADCGFTNIGYTFDGWYTKAENDDNGGEKVTSTSALDALSEGGTKSVTLYARWTRDTSKVAWNEDTKVLYADFKTAVQATTAGETVYVLNDCTVDSGKEGDAFGTPQNSGKLTIDGGIYSAAVTTSGGTTTVARSAKIVEEETNRFTLKRVPNTRVAHLFEFNANDVTISNLVLASQDGLKTAGLYWANADGALTIRMNNVKLDEQDFTHTGESPVVSGKTATIVTIFTDCEITGNANDTGVFFAGEYGAPTNTIVLQGTTKFTNNTKNDKTTIQNIVVKDAEHILIDSSFVGTVGVTLSESNMYAALCEDETKAKAMVDGDDTNGRIIADQDGYTLTWVKLADSVSGADGKTYTHAIRISKQATVKFDLDGGTGAANVSYDDITTLTYGDKVPALPAAPTKDGYAFKGWTINSDTTLRDPGYADYDVNADVVTITAQWLAKVASVDAAVSGGVTEGNVTYFDTLQAALNAAPASGSTVTLLADIKDTNIIISKKLTLDLNGHVLDGTGSGSVITVNATGDLTIEDSGKNVVHKGTLSDDGYFWTYDGTGTAEIKGGIITGGNAASGGGICVIDNGKLTMNAGTIAGNKTNGTAYGGGGVAVFAKAQFTMAGGTISNNVATTNLTSAYNGGGGGVFVALDPSNTINLKISGTAKITENKVTNGRGGGVFAGGYADVVMEGGEISDNYADDENALEKGGGGVMTNGAFTMTGGTITGNKVASGKGGGVYRYESNRNGAGDAGTNQVILGGNAKITDNTGSNLYLPSGRTVTISTEVEPKTGMGVGVTLANGTGLVTAGEDENYAQYFTSDADFEKISYVDNNSKLHVALAATVTLNAKGGTGGDGTVKAIYGQGMPTATMPQLTGYTFNGYFDAETGGKQYYNKDGASASNWDKTGTTATLYAQWTCEEYNITYTLNGGTVTGNPSTYTIETEAFTLNNPTKTGYIFKGWTGIGIDGSASETVTIAKGSTGDRSYTATWELDESAWAARVNTVEDTTYVNSKTEGSTTWYYYDTLQSAINAAKSGTGTTVELLKNVTENVTVSGKTITLDLCGNVIKGNGGRVIVVNSSADLTIKDSEPETPHYYTVSEAKAWTWNDSNTTGAVDYDKLPARPTSGVVMLTGGAITGGNNANDYGGGIYVDDGILTLESGSIVGNTAKDGGGVSLYSGGTFTMNDGTIAGNYVGNCGGGVELFTPTNGAASHFIMNGGTISDNYGANNNGAGVQMDSTGGSFTMTGGLITRNHEKHTNTTPGGVVHMWNGTFTMTGGEITGNTSVNAADGGVTIGDYCTNAIIGGDAKIHGNRANGVENNLYLSPTYLSSGKYVTISTTDAPEDDMNVHVTLANGTGPVTNGAESVDYSGYFTSDAGYEVADKQLSDGKRQVVLTTKYTVAFDANAGGDSSVTGMPASIEDVQYDITPMPTINEPSRTGYAFAGWNTTAGGDGTTMDATNYNKLTTTHNGTVTLYAQWTVNDYNVTLDDNDATSCGELTSYTYGVGATLPTPTKTGYTFGGWYDNDGFTGDSVTAISTTDTGDKTFYAKWTVITYTISYNLDGGSVATENPTSYTVEDAAITLNNPTKTGYTFAGWTGTELGSASTSVTIAQGSTGHREYTAQWTREEYTITYTLNGGTVTGNPATYTIDRATFTLNNPTKTGYIFAGWTGTGIEGTSTSVEIAQGSTGNRTYTATWELDAENNYWVATVNNTNGADNDGTVSYFHTVEDALKNANENGKGADTAIVTLLQDNLTLRTGNVITGDVTLTSSGETPFTLKSNDNGTSLFNVKGSARFTLDDVILEGRGFGSGLIVNANGGAVQVGTEHNSTDQSVFIMKDGAKITKFWTQGYGAAVYVNAGATFRMEGGEITGNGIYVGKRGAGVYAYSHQKLVNDGGTGFVIIGGNAKVYDNFDATYKETDTTLPNNIWIGSDDSQNANPRSVLTLLDTFTGEIGVKYLDKTGKPSDLNAPGALFGIAGEGASIGEGGKILCDADPNVYGVVDETNLKWEGKVFTITYKDQGDAAFSGTNGDSLPTKHTYGTETPLVNASKTGYTFEGWFTDSDCSGTAVANLDATAYTENITLYAKWTEITYTVTFDVQGHGTVPAAETDIKEGGKIPEPAALTETGYTFDGWYKDASCTAGNEWNFESDTVSENITLYAKWEKIGPNNGVRLNLDGMIGVNFFLDLDYYKNVKRVYMEYNDPTKRVPVVRLEKEFTENDFASHRQEDGRYRFSTYAASGQMADDIFIQIWGDSDGDGTEDMKYEEWHYSVRDAAVALMKVYKDDEKSPQLAQALLAYGAIAQTRFNYNTGDLAYNEAGSSNTRAAFEGLVELLNQINAVSLSEIGVEEYKPLWDLGTNAEGLAPAAIDLNCEDRTGAIYKFTLPAEKSASDYMVTFSFVDDTLAAKYNKDIDITKEQEGSRMKISVNNIAAALLDENFKITITGNDGGESTLIASAMNYPRSVLMNPNYATEQQINLVKAIYWYSQAASTYFGQ